jgi:TfoX/Sxy family transcriptional regulator of competence genes
MRPSKNHTLKDMERSVIESALDSAKRELALRYDSVADKLLGTNKAAESDSIKAISGGRPESNRRKF